MLLAHMKGLQAAFRLFYFSSRQSRKSFLWCLSRDFVRYR